MAHSLNSILCNLPGAKFSLSSGYSIAMNYGNTSLAEEKLYKLKRILSLEGLLECYTPDYKVYNLGEDLMPNAGGLYYHDNFVVSGSFDQVNDDPEFTYEGDPSVYFNAGNHVGMLHLNNLINAEEGKFYVLEVNTYRTGVPVINVGVGLDYGRYYIKGNCRRGCWQKQYILFQAAQDALVDVYLNFYGVNGDGDYSPEYYNHEDYNVGSDILGFVPGYSPVNDLGASDLFYDSSNTSGYFSGISLKEVINLTPEDACDYNSYLNSLLKDKECCPEDFNYDDIVSELNNLIQTC